MKKDINILKVQDLAIAIAPRTESEEDHDLFWDAWLINLRSQPLRSIIINSKGYGLIDDIPRKTSGMRYFWEEINGKTAVKIEPVHSKVLSLANEYWVSFVFDDYLYDKKYVFVPDSLRPEHLVTLPIVGKQGVMIK
jgi:hypothetical protein